VFIRVHPRLKSGMVRATDIDYHLSARVFFFDITDRFGDFTQAVSIKNAMRTPAHASKNS